MLKNILKLDGAEQLSKSEQRTITGSLRQLEIDGDGGASFPCYCNGVYKKHCSTVECCWNAC
ncbi:MAG TPA: hypothetical protein VJL37_09895 [Flavobacterium sp.]|nr:hypothetical protein [Flavobacterium sp.]